ncbi:Unknown protein sequence [Pseudomonas coronafaciens pv. oryzae]|nr:Unknown protein sequence [Pseudomonas coronafaciens pv. oryzae]
MSAVFPVNELRKMQVMRFGYKAYQQMPVTAYCTVRLMNPANLDLYQAHALKVCSHKTLRFNRLRPVCEGGAGWHDWLLR